MLVGLASIGFFLNAFNLLPIGFLDGGAVARAIGQARHGWIRYEGDVPVEAVHPDRERARSIALLYILLAAVIVVGLLATKQNGSI